MRFEPECFTEVKNLGFKADSVVFQSLTAPLAYDLLVILYMIYEINLKER